LREVALDRKNARRRRRPLQTRDGNLKVAATGNTTKKERAAGSTRRYTRKNGLMGVRDAG
jgi:hypothetical protein